MNAVRTQALRSAHHSKTITVKHNIDGVTNMSESLALLGHLKKFGTLVSFRFMRDPLTQERTGLAFASYMHFDDVNKAVSSRRQIVSGLQAPFNSIEVANFIESPNSNA
ncbi:hypothetical protein GGI04_001021 [Coemansia thaxteri]|uniref:RRM domain-containing protein n=1 Tax=Coemansia thaxteri TaxID=2663907 RepID=A0A9W8BPE9_9FUNG|nr:hypothetical protein H4R26_000081 [Coemansia thaxteri]KAJ2008747.1 hypothetical protein GGI04_001021 [Coemansia thaxteri]